ncbi:hypothetical protein CAOG_01803 [Capsaspora owczarzaki ATCC 30864]|uniref:DNA polymerase delta subunit 4 n=1 Tax=Capsaspora owczarzaki (strain ATCC 30864) TaxID=595528 RepID=A0A0D2WL42_CAPO3|nr:hypothetical protein CAOG_01803 [Capsaspora owczarzaki ATCC 30864]KJE90493.1 hypothetical protein CAOG_001803 [Capsaspora owczarzaki ATCC 30864]|eukprot:XP_004364671.1 hypothetical protein CAOG_01803 [Capsaspora owczarzaki ATCC 30864]
MSTRSRRSTTSPAAKANVRIDTAFSKTRPSVAAGHVGESIKANAKSRQVIEVLDDDLDATSREQQLELLKAFDLDSEYGPAIGITRLERWERAQKYGLEPPVQIKLLVQAHSDDLDYTKCFWKTDGPNVCI